MRPQLKTVAAKAHHKLLLLKVTKLDKTFCRYLRLFGMNFTTTACDVYVKVYTAKWREAHLLNFNDKHLRR